MYVLGGLPCSCEAFLCLEWCGDASGYERSAVKGILAGAYTPCSLRSTSGAPRVSTV